MCSCGENKALLVESQKVVSNDNIVQNVNEADSDDAFIRRIIKKLAKGKGKMPMNQQTISQGLDELGQMRVVLGLPAPTRKERLEYKMNQAGKQRILLVEEEAAMHIGKGKGAHDDLKE